MPRLRAIQRSMRVRALEWCVIATLLVLGSGCGPGGVQEIWSDPDANEILRRHFTAIRKQSTVKPSDRVRVRGSMRIDVFLGTFTLVQNEQRHFVLQFSGKSDPGTGTFGSKVRPDVTMSMNYGWNGRVEWGKIDGRLLSQDACTEKPDSGLGILTYTEKEFETNPNIRLVGREKLRDLHVFVIEHRPTSGAVAKLYFDVGTYELLAADTLKEGKSGRFDFLDWKVVDGEYGPSRITGKIDGKDFGMVISDIEYDPAIDESKFSP